MISKYLNGRLPKQCRERWCNQLDPTIRKDSLTEEEWKIVKMGHMKYGNKWSEIAKHLNGRTPNHIKNQWNAMMRKKSSDLHSMSSEDDSDLDSNNKRTTRRKRSSSDVSNSDESSTSSSTKKSKPSEKDMDVERLNDDSELQSFKALVDVSCSLLQNHILQEQMKESIFYHQMYAPQYLINQYGVNPTQMYMASMNHGVAKNFNNSVLFNY